MGLLLSGYKHTDIACHSTARTVTYTAITYMEGSTSDC
jgi:hypothetical protein